jgi:hypothetical protein
VVETNFLIGISIGAKFLTPRVPYLEDDVAVVGIHMPKRPAFFQTSSLQKQSLCQASTPIHYAPFRQPAFHCSLIMGAGELARHLLIRARSATGRVVGAAK